jgi:GPI mannosyltransferase 3
MRLPSSIKYQKLLTVAAILVYGITAFNSTGYFHWDEHYQIIEFANVKMGLNKAADVAWEYRAEIRPAIQPAIAFVLFSTARLIGITDPYWLSFFLRLLTAALALVAIGRWLRSTLPMIDRRFQTGYILLSYFLWFLPFLNVRFSSETWSGLLFLYGVGILGPAMLTREPEPSGQGRTVMPFVLSGLLLGTSFLCRAQILFAIAGLLIWLIVFKRKHWQGIGCLVLSAGVIFLLGLAIDAWFYGHLTYTAWNYFNTNIVHGIAAQFGTMPWYFYLPMILQAPTLVIGLGILCSLVFLAIKNPSFLPLWIVLPFLIAHMIISHKEPRFLFPMINFVPLLMVSAWQRVMRLVRKDLGVVVATGASAIAVLVLAVINTVGVVAMAFTPMGLGDKAITSYIHAHYAGRSITFIYPPYKDVYNPLQNLSLSESFYRENNVEEINMYDLKKDSEPLKKTDVTLFVLPKDNVEDPDYAGLIKERGLSPLYQGIPAWVQWIRSLYGSPENGDILILYGNCYPRPD